MGHAAGAYFSPFQGFFFFLMQGSADFRLRDRACRGLLGVEERCPRVTTPYSRRAAGASACTLCNAGSYSVLHPSFSISGAKCNPGLNQEYFKGTAAINGYSSYRSADGSVYVWYQNNLWMFGALSEIGGSIGFGMGVCQTSGCAVFNAEQWSDACFNIWTPDLSFSLGPSTGKAALYTLSTLCT